MLYLVSDPKKHQEVREKVKQKGKKTTQFVLISRLLFWSTEMLKCHVTCLSLLISVIWPQHLSLARVSHGLQLCDILTSPALVGSCHKM